MADLEAFIWHDASGQIVAVGHMAEAADRSIEPTAQEGQSIIRARLPESVLSELHLTHRVDCERGELVEHRRAD